MVLSVVISDASALQSEMHFWIEKIKSMPEGENISYESLVTVYLLMKISELKKEIEVLKNG